jgi:hypothetical protein
MKISKIFGLVIVVLIALFLLRDKLPMGFVKGIFNNEPTIDTITTVAYKYDTITNESKVYVPKWQDRVVIDIDSFIVNQTEPIDTMALLTDYYSKYYYQDTIAVDTFGYVVLKDTISQNQIQSRQSITNVVIPTKTVTHSILINKREIYLGGGFVGSRNYMIANGELLIRTKKRKAFAIGAGIDNQLSPNFTGKIYWQISK